MFIGLSEELSEFDVFCLERGVEMFISLCKVLTEDDVYWFE